MIKRERERERLALSVCFWWRLINFPRLVRDFLDEPFIDPWRRDFKCKTLLFMDFTGIFFCRFIWWLVTINQVIILRQLLEFRWFSSGFIKLQLSQKIDVS